MEQYEFEQRFININSTFGILGLRFGHKEQHQYLLNRVVHQKEKTLERNLEKDIKSVFKQDYQSEYREKSANNSRSLAYSNTRNSNARYKINEF